MKFELIQPASIYTTHRLIHPHCPTTSALTHRVRPYTPPRSARPHPPTASELTANISSSLFSNPTQTSNYNQPTPTSALYPRIPHQCVRPCYPTMRELIPNLSRTPPISQPELNPPVNTHAPYAHVRTHDHAHRAGGRRINPAGGSHRDRPGRPGGSHRAGGSGAAARAA